MHPPVSVVRRSRRFRTWFALIVVLMSSVGEPALADDGATAGRSVTDVVYGPSSRHRLDLLYPPAGVPVRGVVVWGHSGGWVGGVRTITEDRENPRWIAEQGWVIASVTYDLSSSAPGRVHSSFPSAVADLQRAVRWARQHQAELGLGSKVLLGGESAGGHLALLAAVMHPRRVGLKGRDITVDGVIGIVPPTNLVRMYADHYPGWGSAIGAFAGCRVANTAPGPSPCHGSWTLMWRLVFGSVIPWLRQARASRLDIPPIFLVAGATDSLLPAAHHARPTAREWRRITGRQKSAVVRICDCGHNVTPADFDTARLRIWLDNR
jgi:acetyl esterase/lipase